MTRCLQLSFAIILTLSSAAVMAEGGRIHTVAQGETLFFIAQSELGAGSRWPEIAALNGLAAPFIITPGMRLAIPVTPDAQAPADVASVPTSSGETRNEFAHSTADSRTPEVPDTGEVEPAASPIITDTFVSRALPEWSTRAIAITVPRADILIRSPAEAVAIARRENADLLALAAEIDRARAGRTSASLAGRFHPEVEGAFARRFTPNEATGNTDRFNDWGFDVWQELEIAGQRSIRLSVADLQIEKTIAETELEEQAIILGIREAWWESVAALERLRITAQEEAARRWMAEAARFRYEAGDAAGIEVSLADADAVEAEAARLQAEQDLVSAVAVMSRAVGLPEATLAAPDPTSELPSPVMLALDGNVESAALRSRRDLRIELINTRLENERSRLALAEGAPNIRVGFGYEREEGATDVYALKFGIPLPLGNLRRGEADEARAAARVSESRSEALRRRILNEARGARENTLSVARRHELVARGVIARVNDNLTLAAQAYAEGKIGMTQFLAHFDQAATNRRLGVETRLDWQRSLIALERAMGTDISRNQEGAGR